MTSGHIGEILDFSEQAGTACAGAGRGHFPSTLEVAWVACLFLSKADLLTVTQIGKNTKRQQNRQARGREIGTHSYSSEKPVFLQRGTFYADNRAFH